MLAELKAKGVAGDDKRVPACARIYDYIDDVESRFGFPDSVRRAIGGPQTGLIASAL